MNLSKEKKGKGERERGREGEREREKEPIHPEKPYFSRRFASA